MDETRNRIKKMRLEHCLTLKDTAQRLGIKEATMQRYESGVIKNIKYEYIEELAKLFSCTPAYLMGWGEFCETDSEGAGNPQIVSPVGILNSPDTPIPAAELLFPCPEGVRADLYYKIADDSMNGGRFRRGDTVLIDSSAEIGDGDTVLVFDGTEYSVRRIYISGESTILRPDNTGYAPRIYSKRDRKKIRIIGKITAYFSTDV